LDKIRKAANNTYGSLMFAMGILLFID